MKIILAVLTAAVCLLSACSKGFEPIRYGKDACAHCKMTIMDKRFAAELVNPKGKVFKFDDISCLRAFTSELAGSMVYVNGFGSTPENPLDAVAAVYLRHESFNSPMNGNLAAFADEADAAALKDSLRLELFTWETLP